MEKMVLPLGPVKAGQCLGEVFESLKAEEYLWRSLADALFEGDRDELLQAAMGIVTVAYNNEDRFDYEGNRPAEVFLDGLEKAVMFRTPGRVWVVVRLESVSIDFGRDSQEAFSRLVGAIRKVAPELAETFEEQEPWWEEVEV